MRKPKVLFSPQFGRWKPLIKKNEELIKDKTIVIAPKCLGLFCMGLLFKNTLFFFNLPCCLPCLVSFWFLGRILSWFKGIVWLWIVDILALLTLLLPGASLFWFIPAWFVFATWRPSLASRVTCLYLLMPKHILLAMSWGGKTMSLGIWNPSD